MNPFSFLSKPLSALVFAAALPAPAMAAWEVDPAHTHISFQVSHLQLTKTPGIFKRFNATLDFDEKKIERSSVRFVIDASSIDTAHEGRDTDLQGPDWFDAVANPSITFVSNRVRAAGGNRYLIDGNLSLRGKAVPVTFSARLTSRAENPFLKVPAVGFEATAKIKRSAFGMTSYLAAISDEVELRVALELLKKP